jgi:transposase
MPKKYIVTLTERERDTLYTIIKKGKNAAKIRRAYLLLAADASAEGKQMNDQAIQHAYNVSLRSVERLRQRFGQDGFEVALNGKPREPRPPRWLDGEVEAHLIALTRTQAPDGYADWTLRLLADKMVELDYVETISHESVRQLLKKRTEAA